MVLVLVVAILAASEGKRKRKFEGDFEFADEVSWALFGDDRQDRCTIVDFAKVELV